MKKILTLLLAAVMILSFAACTGMQPHPEDTPEPDPKPGQSENDPEWNYNILQIVDESMSDGMNPAEPVQVTLTPEQGAEIAAFLYGGGWEEIDPPQHGLTNIALFAREDAADVLTLSFYEEGVLLAHFAEDGGVKTWISALSGEDAQAMLYAMAGIALPEKAQWEFPVMEIADPDAPDGMNPAAPLRLTLTGEQRERTAAFFEGAPWEEIDPPQHGLDTIAYFTKEDCPEAVTVNRWEEGILLAWFDGAGEVRAWLSPLTPEEVQTLTGGIAEEQR